MAVDERQAGHRGSARRPNRRERREALDADQIVRAAIAIADEQGRDAITMRAVASRLGVGVMSLYWHVPTKRDLEGLLLQQMMDEAAPPPDPTGDWREDLGSIARNARKNMLRHPWMVDLFSSADASPEAAIGHGLLRHIERTMRMVDNLPLDFVTKVSMISMIDDFTRGFTASEIVDRRRHAAIGLSHEDLRTQAAPRIRELLAEQDYPLFREYIQRDHELPDMDTRFELALQIMLDGIGVQIERARQAGAGPGTRKDAHS